MISRKIHVTINEIFIMAGLLKTSACISDVLTILTYDLYIYYIFMYTCYIY